VLQTLSRRDAPETAFAHSFWWVLGVAALSILAAVRMPG
jgi:hypothetical protein